MFFYLCVIRLTETYKNGSLHIPWNGIFGMDVYPTVKNTCVYYFYSMEHQRISILKALADTYLPLADVSFQRIAEAAAFTVYAKDAFILREEKKDANEYFLLDGIAHRFNVTDEGKTVTTGFYLPPAVMIPHFARTIDGKSVFSLQLLSDAVVASIPVVVFDKLREAHDDIGRWGNAVVERELYNSLRDDTVFRTMDARQRLLLLRTRYPNLENLVPHHMIASYLGITPVSFSRLRNELANPS